MPIQKNDTTATTNDMVASAEKNCKSGALTFLSKRLLMSTGESFGSDTLSDWCMQKDFGQLDWFHASNLDQSFPSSVSRLPLACSSYDIPWVGREACWTGRVKNQMASLIVKVETFVHLKERRGHKLNYRFNETSSPCLNFLWKFDINEIESQVSSQYTFDRFCE